jgi:hypothetical protein
LDLQFGNIDRRDSLCFCKMPRAGGFCEEEVDINFLSQEYSDGCEHVLGGEKIEVLGIH